jgi:hypothetical protein
MRFNPLQPVLSFHVPSIEDSPALPDDQLPEPEPTTVVTVVAATAGGGSGNTANGGSTTLECTSEPILTRNLIVQVPPLVKLAHENESPVAIVNSINFKNPIKLTPRRSHTIEVQNLGETSRASHNFLDYALAHFAVGKTKSSKIRTKMKKRITATKVSHRAPLSCHAYRHRY